VLSLGGIHAGYGGTTVLVDVALDVPTNSVVALLGPNGAGKTTLLRVASGQLAPQSGRVLVDGADATRWSASRRAAAGLCLVPEGRGVFPNLTVRENLVVFSPRGRERESVELATAAFPELARRIGQEARQLSGGEQQMLALARAYVQRPRYVLLDEVSMGLAPLVVERIFGFVTELARNGAALLLVEQYVTRALELADVVYLLNKGEITFRGSPAELSSEDVFAEYLGTASRR
jgi:branched-chain amino acid transport system ATP-binding protein